MGSQPLTCERCGMIYYEWLLDEASALALFTPGAVVPEGMVPNIHECPEPYPREQAEHLARFYATTGTPGSQRTKARIKLGLEAPE